MRLYVSQSQFRSALFVHGERTAVSNALSLAETVGEHLYALKDHIPHYHIEHLHDQGGEPLDFEAMEFDAPEKLLKKTLRSEIQPYHKHSFYSILWSDRGTSSHYIDGVAYQQKANSLTFICPGQIHQNKIETTDNLQGGVILFNSNFFSSLRSNHTNALEISFLNNFYSNPVLNLSENAFDTVKQTIKSILAERALNAPDKSILQSLLFVLLMQIQRHIDIELKRSIPNHAIDVYKQFTGLLEANFKNGWSIEEYASQLNVSSRHLNRLLQEATSKSTSELIRARIILEAKRLLSYSTLSISEVGAQLGYFDNSYFNRVFKQEIGLTPLAFRQSMSE